MLKLANSIFLWQVFCSFIESFLGCLLNTYLVMVYLALGSGLILVPYIAYVFVQRDNNGVILLGVILGIFVLWFMTAHNNFNKRFRVFESGVKPPS
jgi:hypothetical protein